MELNISNTSIALLVSGIILFFACFATSFKIYNTSKSKFAYTLIAFSFGYAISFIAEFFNILFAKSYTSNNG